MNNNKVIALVVGGVVALFAVWMVFRMFILSQYGFGVSPLFYLGLPIGGISVIVLLLLRLGLLGWRLVVGCGWRSRGATVSSGRVRPGRQVAPGST